MSKRLKEKPEVGPFLHQLIASGSARADLLSEESSRQRLPPCVSDAVSVNAPHGWTFGDKSFEIMVPSNIYLAKLPDGILIGSDGLVAVDGQILADTVRHLTYWNHQSLTKSFVSGSAIEFKRSVDVNLHMSESCFVGFAGSWRNYAHWMNESMPRIYAYCCAKRRMPALKLVLPPISGFQNETVDLLGIKRSDIVTIHHDDAIEFDTLYTIGAIDIWTVPNFLRRAAEYLVKVAVGTLAEPQRKIYIHRKHGNRLVTNFTEVESFLGRAGIDVVSFENMPLVDQIRIMSESKVVIGEHGAGLINTVFMPPGGAVLEIFNEACPQPAYWSVASLMAARFGFLIGRSSNPSDWNSDYEVDIQRLGEALHQLA